ncbi:uncharacterized protein LOC117565564 [Drosophila albomicans]|uniref:Uncharacterized protein LOC117565564 n=1 Tax=Drosophila albomicans TaxID=7291 RepID=A0A6P8WMT6_DROAB|nr:uncharacterized protein LOC117565564 [Drosophila albomicans]
MLNSCSWLAALLLCGCIIGLSASSDALQQDGSALTMSNSIAAPGQPLYYLMADAGPTVGPNDELKRTNRSLMKWWEDLFGPNNCCNNNNNLLPINNNLLPINNNNVLPAIVPNNCNGLQLQNLDPFKQMKLFKKLPDLWGNTCGGQCGQCGNAYVPPVDAGYVAPQPQQPQQPAPVAPVDYNAAPVAPAVVPNPAYDGPGDGDAGYVAPPVAPVADNYVAPPTVDNYVPPPSVDNYAAPPAASYEAPVPTPDSYEPAPAPAPQSYSKVEEKGNYGDAQPPQIVYQPIIYLSASPAAKEDTEVLKYKPQEQSYEAQTEPPQAQPIYEPPQAQPIYEPPPAPPAPVAAYVAPPPAAPPCNAPACGYLPLVGVPFYSYPASPPAPAYAPPAPAPSYAPPPPPAVAPPAPAYSAPSCQTPIRLSLHDQPYRVAPELFQEYNYRLALADRNSL